VTIELSDAAVTSGAVWVGNLALFAIFLVSIAALTTLYSVLAAVAAIVVELNLLPDNVTGYLTGAVAILAAILGALTHTKVTPLVNPRNNDGVPLIPARRSGGLVK
jgi:prepilin signal peptidase PulO-like enzyme (type II secretory pathway)